MDNNNTQQSNNTEQVAQATQGTEAAQATTEANKEEVTFQDIEKKIFTPEQVEGGSEYVNQVMQLASEAEITPLFNFDSSADFPAGYSLAVVPLTRRVPERGNEIYGVVIAAIPSLDELTKEDAGVDFVTKILLDNLVRQIAVAAKPKDEGALTSLPFKVEEFITSARTSGLAAFNAVASDFVRALKKKGLKFISKPMLRQLLASAKFAEQQFPHIAQTNWVIVLNSMIAHVSGKGIDTGVLKHWINTRDTVEIDTTELDLSDLEDLV